MVALVTDKYWRLKDSELGRQAVDMLQIIIYPDVAELMAIDMEWSKKFIGKVQATISLHNLS